MLYRKPTYVSTLSLHLLTGSSTFAPGGGSSRGDPELVVLKGMIFLLPGILVVVVLVGVLFSYNKRTL